LRINVQLIRVRDDFPLWSGRYDREMTDVFAIQDEISRGIVNSLRLKLGSGQRRYETSAEAYDLYLRARALEIQSGLPGWNQSIGPFEEVIAKDPAFAPGYAARAAAHAARSGQSEIGQFPVDRGEEMSKMRATAEKAIRLDPLLAEAHDALGLVYGRDAKWEQSEKSFRRAMELDPNRAESHCHFVMFFLLPLGRVKEALKQVRIAEKIDPLSPNVQAKVAWVLLAAGKYEEAASHCQKLSADFPSKGVCVARVRLGQGDSTKPSRSSPKSVIGPMLTVILAMPTGGPAAARRRRKWRRTLHHARGYKLSPLPAWATRTALSRPRNG
jgi:tetratricopeptide (TPR) repeat protein